MLHTPKQHTNAYVTQNTIKRTSYTDTFPRESRKSESKTQR